MRIIYFLGFIIFSNTVFAQVALDKGEPAPEDGVFLTKEEAAKVIAEKQSAEQVCKINQEAAVSLEKNKCTFDKELLKNELLYEKTKYEEINKLRNLQEEKLFKAASDSGDNLYWFLGGIAAGATVTAVSAIGVILFVNQAKQ